MIEAEWHGSWRPIEVFVYDDFSAVAGPACELVGFEQRCGKVYRTPQGAERHEAKCAICKSYKRANA